MFDYGEVRCGSSKSFFAATVLRVWYEAIDHPAILWGEPLSNTPGLLGSIGDVSFSSSSNLFVDDEWTAGVMGASCEIVGERSLLVGELWVSRLPLEESSKGLLGFGERAVEGLGRRCRGFLTLFLLGLDRILSSSMVGECSRFLLGMLNSSCWLECALFGLDDLELAARLYPSISGLVRNPYE